MHKDSPDSEQELRWRGWQEKGRLARSTGRQADERDVYPCRLNSLSLDPLLRVSA